MITPTPLLTRLPRGLLLRGLLSRPLCLWLCLLLSFAAAPNASAQGAPAVSVGRLERLANFPSKNVDPRSIDVWLPPGYVATKRYAVLYMHDGQNLFDGSQTWNKQAWNVHLALAQLIAAGQVPETIIVGIPSNGAFRYSEYYPDKWLALAPAAVAQAYRHDAQNDRVLADAYLRFIVDELKPVIDQRYATRPEAAGTFIMGSSMGGLISVYAVCEYPQVFGGAAGLSIHWVGRSTKLWGAEKIQNAALPLAAFNYLQTHLPPPGSHRIYVDHGTQGIDAYYGVHHQFIDELAKERGYTPAQWQSRIFEGTGHGELDWAARVAIPLQFLLGKP